MTRRELTTATVFILVLTVSAALMDIPVWAAFSILWKATP